MKRYDCHGEFTVQCRGRDENGDPVFREDMQYKPITVQLLITKRPGSNDLFSLVDCPYLRREGRDGRCDAIHNLGGGIVVEYADCSPVGGGYCAYHFDIPELVDILRRDRK